MMVLIFVGAYYASRLMGGQFASGGRMQGSIEILDRAMLGKDKGLFVARVAGRVFLLGVSNEGITKIEELRAEDYPSAGPPAPPPDFVSFLKDAIGKRHGGGNPK